MEILLAGLLALEDSHFEPGIFSDAVDNATKLLALMFPDDNSN
jgi:hypothetical protein